MKRFILFSFICLFSMFIFSCTENQRARRFGGTMTIKVKEGYKVTSATWKEKDLFYFIEPMEDNYQPNTKFFIEESDYGIIESQVKFVEKR